MPNTNDSFPVPALFLRRSWFHILSHITIHPNAYRGYFNSTLKTAVMRTNLITVLQPLKISFSDAEEQKLFNEGVITKSGKIDLKFESVLKINSYVAAICESINRAGKFGRNLDGNVIKAGKIDLKIEKGSVVQTAVHAALSNFKMTDDETCVFEPQKHHISRAIAQKVLDYALKILPEIFPGDESLIAFERKKIEELKELVKNHHKLHAFSTNNSKTEDPVIGMHQKFWQNGRYLSSFQNTKWLMMIRTDSNQNLYGRLGIVVNTVQFESIEGGYLTCRMHGMYYSSEDNTPVNTDYSGIATCGRKKQYMHIEWLKDIDEENEFQPAFLSLRINESATQKLMLGHYTYYSNRCHKYLTKLVVFWKFNENDCFLTSNRDTGDINEPDFMKDYVKHLNRLDNPVEFDKIPQDIRVLLNGRTDNRLTMPGEPVRGLKDSSDSLQSFIAKFYGAMQDEAILQTFCGEYAICYYYSEGKIDEFADFATIEANLRTDLMTVSFNKDALTFDVSYSHRRSEKLKEEFEGSITRKQGSVEIILRPKSKTKHRLKSPEENYMFLIVSIPHDAVDFETTFKASKIFPGIISGLKDGRFIPVAHYAIISRPDFLLEEDTQKRLRIKDDLREKVSDHFKRKRDHLGIIINPSFYL